MREESIKKINFYLINILRISLILALFLEIYKQRWFTFFITLLTIFLTFIPLLIEKKYKIDIPEIFEILMILFIFAALYLGEVQKFYLKFWWWDIFLHFWSAMALGIIGLTILFIIYKKRKIEAKPIWISIFVFSFAVSIGAIWEIFEFFVDLIFNTNMQKMMLGDISGLTDTMIDLTIDSLGGLIASIIGYFYINKKRKGYILKTIETFISELDKN
jgi:uncharacterized membrane protein YjdF